MIGQRYDWLLVQLDQVAEAVRKVAASAMGEELDEDERLELEDQVDELLEDTFDHSGLAPVDARTAALIIRPPNRVRSYAALLRAKSRLLAQRGEQQTSRHLARRALDLHLEAAMLDLHSEHIDRAAIQELLDLEPALALGARQEQILETLADPTAT